MAKDKPAKYWRFKLDTRRKFTELSQEIARINSGGGTDIDLTDYATKVWVEAQGYITASALTPYALKTDIPSLAGYATEVFVNNKLNAYTTTEDLAENYASKNDLETAINNIDLSPYLKTEDAEGTYATKDFVNNKLVDYAPLTSVQGFENRIGGLEGAVPQLNERVTTVEGKVSSLNETVSTGENNLLDRVNTIETDYVTSGNLESAINSIDLSAYLLKADLTKSRIQSTLGISDWALASVKPTYTASEVGALGVKDTAQQSYGLRHSTTPISDTGLHWWSGQFQVSTEPVSGKVYLGSSGDYTVISVPKIDGTSSVANACVLRLGFNRQYFHEIFTSPNSNNIYHRNVRKGNGNPWRQFAFTSDIPTKLSQLTDDVVAGKYLPLSGGTLSNALWRSQLTIERSGSTNDSVIAFTNSNGLLGCLGYRGADGIPCVWLGETGTGAPIIHANNIDSYNAGTATKLQTPRKLWGQSFDGTDHIGGDITLNAFQDGRQLSILQSGQIKFSIPSGNGWATSLDIYASDKTTLLTSAFGAYGGGNYVKYAFIGGTYDHPNVVVRYDTGKVGIGNTSPTEKLDVAGNIKASGNINATSITINGVTITASNGTITVNGNVFATGDIVGGV